MSMSPELQALVDSYAASKCRRAAAAFCDTPPWERYHVADWFGLKRHTAASYWSYWKRNEQKQRELNRKLERINNSLTNLAA